MRIETEDKIQQDCVMWYNNTYCLKHHSPRSIILAIPNGGSRNIMEGKKLKNTGVLRGASDLLIVQPDKVLFVELKTSTGRQSSEQLDFETRVTALGYEYHLCRSLEEFKSLFLTN